MNIAVNTRFLLKDRLEGIGWFTYETLKRITQNHPEHTFYFFFDRPYDEKFMFGDNVVPVVLNPPARHPVLFYIWFETSVRRALKKYKADAFISTDGFLTLGTPVPTLLVIHDIAFEHFPQHLSPVARRYMLYYSPRFARKATRIATVSEYSKQDIVQQYGIDEAKIDVVYNGINDTYRPLPADTVQQVKDRYGIQQDYFIFAGALHPRKNVANLFRAFDLFRQQTGSSAQLVIVGRKAWNFKDMLHTYNNMQHKEAVLFTGHLSAEELAALYNGALALTYVSLFEGFGIPIIEAMQCNTPVITSNCTSMPEVAGDAALLVDPNQPQRIADAMCRISKEPELRNELINKGKERRSHFSWDKTAKNLWQSVLNVLQKAED